MSTGIEWFQVEGGQVGFSWDRRGVSKTVIYVEGNPVANPPLPADKYNLRWMDWVWIGYWVFQVPRAIASSNRETTVRKLTEDEIAQAKEIRRQRKAAGWQNT